MVHQERGKGKNREYFLLVKDQVFIKLKERNRP